MTADRYQTSFFLFKISISATGKVNGGFRILTKLVVSLFE